MEDEHSEWEKLKNWLLLEKKKEKKCTGIQEINDFFRIWTR